MDECLLIAKAAQKLTQKPVAAASRKDLRFAALTSDRKADLRPQLKPLLDEFHGKGGGGPQFFQGQFESKDDFEGFVGKWQ
jgi:alanyl-tRNA synthetase